MTLNGVMTAVAVCGIAKILVSDNDEHHIRHRCGVSAILAPPSTNFLTYLLTYFICLFINL